MSVPGEDVAILIPAYNEGETIREVVREVKKALPRSGIVVISDGSRDDTARIAREEGAVVVDLPFNLGIGAAMQTGYQYAREHRYRIAVQIDGDGQHIPSEVPRLIAALEEGADLAIGSRFVGGGGYQAPILRRIGMIFFSITVSALVHRKFHDTTSGFRAAGRQAIEYFAAHYPSDYPEPEAILLLCRAGFDVREVPATIRERGGGHSSITFLRGAFYLLKVFLALAMGTLRRSPGQWRS